MKVHYCRLGWGLLCAVSIVFAWGAGGTTIAYWRFDEGAPGTAAKTVVDSSGYGYNGVAINGPTYSSQVPAASIPSTHAADKTALAFNGTTQRIFIGDYPGLALTHSLTIEAYVNVHAVLGAAGDILFRGDDRIGNDAYGINVINHVLRFGIGDANNNSTLVSAPIPYDTWVHVAGTLDDATGKLSLYENGALVAFNTTTLRPYAMLDPNSSPGLGIGNVQSPNYNQYFDGLIDELRVSDQALTPSQFINAPEPAMAGWVGIGAMVVISRHRARRGGSGAAFI